MKRKSAFYLGLTLIALGLILPVVGVDLPHLNLFGGHALYLRVHEHSSKSTPISGAYVEVESLATGETVWSGLTDANGEVKAWAPERSWYWVLVTKDDFQTGKRVLYFPGSEVIYLFKVGEQKPSTASLQFIVKRDNYDATPIRNAEVAIYPADEHGNVVGEGMKGYTDSRGIYTFKYIPAQILYKWVVSADGFVTQTGYEYLYINGLVYVEMERSDYTLTIKTSVGGITDPIAGKYEYKYGDEVTVYAKPGYDYRFSMWILNGVNRTENPIMIRMDRNYVLEPIFTYSPQPQPTPTATPSLTPTPPPTTAPPAEADYINKFTNIFTILGGLTLLISAVKRR